MKASLSSRHTRQKELSKLYADMWSRLNEDQVLYRQDAARFFNLVIAAKEINSFLETESVDQGMSPMSGGVSLFQLMVAQHPKIRRSFLERDLERDDSIFERCSETRMAIQTRCAGLLDFSSPGNNWMCPNPNVLGITLNTKVEFIHRSAYDFLIDTEDGHKLCQIDTSSSQELQIELIEGYLARTRIGLYITGNLVFMLMPLASSKGNGIVNTRTRALLETPWKWY